VLSPCVTFVGKEQFSLIKQKLHYLEKDPDYGTSDRGTAFRVAEENDRISVGVIYRQERPAYGEKLAALREKSTSRSQKSLESLMDVFRP
jgi:hypothetical protein